MTEQLALMNVYSGGSREAEGRVDGEEVSKCSAGSNCVVYGSIALMILNASAG